MSENKYDPLTIDRSKYPPNKGDKKREPLQKVAQATIEKPSKRKKILNVIFSGDAEVVKEKIIYDVIIPMAKDFIANGLKGIIDTSFYGKTNQNYTSYSRASQPSQTRSYYNRSSAMNIETPRDREIERNLSFQSKEEAYSVLDKLEELIELYGQVSVADLCDITGVDSDFTDNRYGWKSLRNVLVVKRGERWILDLPRTRVID